MILAGLDTLAGTKAGNPWHGTWTEAGLELPNTTVMELPVAVDGGANGWPAYYPVAEPNLTINGPKHGDCLLVRFPDISVPETSEAEEALGMKWLNYTLISGANRLLYGVPIGKASWVYLDSNDQPWLVEIMPLLLGTSKERFRFSSRFIFGETVTEIIAEYDYGSDSVIASEKIVFDASQTGRSVACAQYYYTETTGNWVQPVVSRWVLSGTPGVDLAISREVAETPFSDPDHIWGYGEPWVGIAYPAGHLSNTQLLAPYWVFDGDDAISLRAVIDYDASAWPLVENETWHVDRTLEGTISVLTPFGSFDIAFTSTVSEPSYGVFSFAFEIDGWSYSYSQDDVGLTETSGFLPYIYTVRQTNKVVEVVFSAEWLSADNMDIPVYSICRILPDRFEATGVTTTFDQIPGYMTYHPVTKELLESSSPVCFM